jgi:serine/threonine protein kinase
MEARPSHANNPDPLVGKTLLHYEVLEKLGEGGMGVVYKARDPRLDRLVALKVLPTIRTADPVSRERFIREARAASALNHPHIVTIYDIASAGGIDFIVMEYLGGRPLSELIPRRGLAVGHALQYALQIADAMAAAHNAGIIHRDLKPANVVVAGGGRLRVLDFGLAKLTGTEKIQDTSATVSTLTEEGIVLGTFSYMAPEQAIGKPVDRRADIFSFGVMLYEMLTGELPFTSANIAATIHDLHYGAPKSVREIAPRVPVALEHVLDRAMAKQPEARYQTMEAVIADLWAVALADGADVAGNEPDRAEQATSAARVSAREPTAPASADARARPPRAGSERASIAVLPFTSLSSDKEDEYLAAGIAAELISALSGVPGLRVASHLASYRFQGIPDLQKVAETLNIRYVLTGSLRRAGSRIRVMAELTDAMPGVQLWAKTYERGIEDVFAVQEEIAREIVSATGGQLIRAGSERASRTPPENLDAWGLVRRAYHFWNHAFTLEGVEDSLNLLRRAVQMDPGYAAARAFLGLYLIQRVVNFMSPNPSADVAEALAAAEAAIDLAPRDPEVLENAGLVYFNSGHYEDSVRALTRAVEIAPFNLVAWGYLGCAHAWTGEDRDVVEGEKILDRLLKTAPDHPSVPYWLYFKSAACIRLDRPADARDAAGRSTELQPHFFISRIAYANALGVVGETGPAMQQIGQALAVNPGVTPQAYVDAVMLLSRTVERGNKHLAGLRAAGWIA